MSSDGSESESAKEKAIEALKEATTTFSSRFILAEGVDDYPIPIFVIDMEHKIAVWNKPLARLTGQAEKVMLGSETTGKLSMPASARRCPI